MNLSVETGSYIQFKDAFTAVFITNICNVCEMGKKWEKTINTHIFMDVYTCDSPEINSEFMQ